MNKFQLIKKSRKKLKTAVDNKDIMATVFCDQKGVIVVEFLEPKTTIIATGFFQIVPCSQKASKINHGDVRSHSADVAKRLLNGFQSLIFNNPAYSFKTPSIPISRQWRQHCCKGMINATI